MGREQWSGGWGGNAVRHKNAHKKRLGIKNPVSSFVTCFAKFAFNDFSIISACQLRTALFIYQYLTMLKLSFSNFTCFYIDFIGFVATFCCN